MKKLTALFLAIMMILGSVSICLADTVKFSDVDANSEIGKSVYKLADAGIINGYEDGTFRLNAQLTRAELCKMINKAFNYTEKADNIFTDVKSDDWYYSEVLAAVKAGYIKGFEYSTFRGDDNVSREQICAILNRIVKKTADTSKVVISDEVSDWAEADVKNVIALGYFSVEAGNTFRATVDITRAELARALVIAIDSTSDNTKNDDDKKTDTTDDKKTDTKNNGSSGGSSGGGGSSGRNDNDQAKINDTIEKINAIGEITKDTAAENKKAIEVAEKAYDSLTESEKKLVTNYSVLTAAKEEYAKLEAELSAEICKNLEAAMSNLELIEFNGKAAEVVEYFKKDIDETLKSADGGTIVTNDYVRTTYADDINTVKSIIDGMTAEEKEAFKTEILKINTASLMYITKYFDVNLAYLD